MISGFRDTSIAQVAAGELAARGRSQFLVFGLVGVTAKNGMMVRRYQMPEGYSCAV